MVIDFNGAPPSQGPSKNRIGGQASQEAKRSSGQESGKATQAPSPTGENVSFSAKAQGFQALESSIKDMPDTNNEKVAALKAAVEDGSYQVDSEKLAQKMLDFDSSMF